MEFDQEFEWVSDIHLRVLPRVWSTGADWDWEVEQVEEEEATVLDRAGENRALDNSDS